MLILISILILDMVLNLMCVYLFNCQVVVNLVKIMIFGVDNSSSTHTDNRKNNILILGKGPTDGLVDITISVEAECSIKFNETRKKFCLSLCYNGSKNLNCLLIE